MKMTAESKSRRRALRHLAHEVDSLGAEMRQAERKARVRIEAVDSTFELSARNLVRYLALRRHDRRALQRSLAQLGLSSLGRAEEWVAALDDGLALRGAQHPHMLQHAGMGQGTGDIVAIQALVETHRSGEFLNETVGRLCEASGPGFMGIVLRHVPFLYISSAVYQVSSPGRLRVCVALPRAFALEPDTPYD